MTQSTHTVISFTLMRIKICLNNSKCESANSLFFQPHYKYKTTGDLGIIKSDKLRKPLTECQNYRDPQPEQ